MLAIVDCVMRCAFIMKMRIFSFLLFSFLPALLNSKVERGMVLCTGTKTLDDAISVVSHIRHVWNSSIPAYVMHCDELNQVNSDHLQVNNIVSYNMCNSQGLFGMSYEDTIKRLQNWWCKAAALVLAPMKEVIVVDIDVVFFKNPELLFETKGL